jgi:hypothetical protein
MGTEFLHVDGRKDMTKLTELFAILRQGLKSSVLITKVPDFRKDYRESFPSNPNIIRILPTLLCSVMGASLEGKEAEALTSL